jgi:hypothetical protein
MFDYRAALKDLPDDKVSAARVLLDRARDNLRNGQISNQEDVRACCILLERFALKAKLFPITIPSGQIRGLENLNELLAPYNNFLSKHEMEEISSSIDDILDAYENRVLMKMVLATRILQLMRR